MTKREFKKELTPLVKEVIGFKSLVGKKFNDTPLAHLADYSAISPIYANMDSGDTDLYFPSISTDNGSISIIFSVDVNPIDDTIISVNLYCTDIIANAQLNCAIDLENINYDDIVY